MGRVEVDYEKCIGCRTCVSVCPFGAMHFVASDRKVIKCDLCDGDPQCVRFCDTKAVRSGRCRGRQPAKRKRSGQTDFRRRIEKPLSLWPSAMKITVEFLSLPNVVKMVGSKSGHTGFLGKLLSTTWSVKWRENTGSDVQKFLLDETGQLDMSLALTDQQAGMDSSGPDGQTTAGRRPGNHHDAGRRRIRIYN